MDISATHSSSIVEEKPLKRSSFLINQSLHSKNLHKNSSFKVKRLDGNSPKVASDTFTKIDRSLIRVPTHKRSVKTLDFTETCHHLEKVKHFTSKLAYLLSNKTTKSTTFQIYSEIFFEVSDCFPEFKELFAKLRKGLVISAIKEKDFEEFEYKNEVEKHESELPNLLEKERKENQKLIKKLNLLANENLKIKQDFEKMHKKYLDYEEIIHTNPNHFIEAEKLFEKMMEQCEIIQKQQNYIQELKISDIKLKKILQYCEGKGICIESMVNCEENTVINPSLTKVFKRSLTMDKKYFH
ncbi:hypothetical protein SteCoe_27764 [Stentor coeruleus]|uniref:Uncharacterized protein n=1 Tax=Stentor coeruleus TaxID=5963 RepID=A0A1R2B9U6_9CILI|nr:hypothetical protein SteCoe_27764 [Stentor coeruleus]